MDLPDRHPSIDSHPRRGHGHPSRWDRLRVALPPLPDGGAAVVPRGLDPGGMPAERAVRAGRTDACLGAETGDCGGQAGQARLLREVRAAVEHVRDDVAPGRPGRAWRSRGVSRDRRQGPGGSDRRRVQGTDADGTAAHTGRRVARRPQPRGRDAHQRGGGLRRQLAGRSPRCESGALDEGARVWIGRPAGGSQPDADARGAARHRLPVVRRHARGGRRRHRAGGCRRDHLPDGRRQVFPGRPTIQAARKPRGVSKRFSTARSRPCPGSADERALFASGSPATI